MLKHNLQEGLRWHAVKGRGERQTGPFHGASSTEESNPAEAKKWCKTPSAGRGFAQPTMPRGMLRGVTGRRKVLADSGLE